MPGVQNIEEFLNPEKLKHKLLSFSLFVLGYEILKDGVVERLKSFFSDSHALSNKRGSAPGPEFRKHVKRLNKNSLKASLLWFQEEGAINQKDIEVFYHLKDSRDKIVHEMGSFLEKSFDLNAHFIQLIALIKKIDIWWIKNIEASINPYFDDIDLENIDDSEIGSGKIMLLQMLQNIALGPEDKAGTYLKLWEEIRRK